MEIPARLHEVIDDSAGIITPARSLIRLPELDGLRGVAILVVMSSHFLELAEGYGMFHAPAGSAWWWLLQLQYSGWMGVDLFFALSGFLITGILVDSKDRPHYFRNFYVRRTLRIFPAYYLLLLLWFLLEPFFSPGNQGTLNPNYAVWLWTYATNILISLDGWLSMPVPVRHLWSLAVEEQFYLLWPLVIYCLDRRKALVLCASLVLLGPMIRMALGHWFAPLTADYVLMPARMDSLAAGSLMALLWRERREIAGLLRVARGLAAAAFILMAAMFATHRGLSNADAFVRVWGMTLFAILFASLILLAVATGDSAVPYRQVLRSRMLKWFGRYSYGLYLWHKPVCLYLYSTRLMNLLARTYAPHSMSLFILLLYAAPLLASTAVAYASWHLWEVRFLRLKTRLHAGPVIA